MSAERALASARARLEQLKEKVAEATGAHEEAASVSREIEQQLRARFRYLATSGELQKRWDTLRDRAEAMHSDGRAVLMQVVLGLLEESAGITQDLMIKRERFAREQLSNLVHEKNTLEWLIGESESTEHRLGAGDEEQGKTEPPEDGA